MIRVCFQFCFSSTFIVHSAQNSCMLTLPRLALCNRRKYFLKKHPCSFFEKASLFTFWKKHPCLIHRLSAWRHVKGQLISECSFDVWKFSKIPPKNLIDFCPESLFRLGMYALTWVYRVPLRLIKTNQMYLVYKTFQCRNQSNFFGGILESRWFSKNILTLSDP